MNKIWQLMMVCALCILIVNDPANILTEMIGASSLALGLCVELCGVYAVWLGILELVDASGLGDKLAKILRPIIKKLFKVDNTEIEKMIALNMSANMLGLGNAATPMGIKALKALDTNGVVASPQVIMFIVINATSIQLLPSTVISLRSNAGSINPADIILPTLISTTVTTGVGIILTLVCNKIRLRKKKA